jgi:regulator of protease activity HflC (stomatin/prohibitin superfamily)
MTAKTKVTLAALLGGLVLVLWGGCSSFYCVSAGHVGVASLFGNVRPEPLAPGWHWKNPLVSVKEIETRLFAFHDDAPGASRDLQVVTTQITVQYSIVGSQAPGTWKEIGDHPTIEAAILKPAIQESVKSVTAQFTAEQLVTHRHVVKGQVEAALRKYIATTLADKQLPGAIDVGNVALTDFRFSDEFNHAIEQKVKTAQEALQAEKQKTKTITEAEAAREARNKASEAEAYRVKTVAAARAEAIRREGEALAKNPEVIKLRATQQWDGKLPTFMGGQQPVPILNVPQK